MNPAKVGASCALRRLPILVLSLIVVVVAILATAVGVVMAICADNPRVAMAPDDVSRLEQHAGLVDDSWNSMMTTPMMMGSYASASEAEYLVEMAFINREAVAAARALAVSYRPQMRRFWGSRSWRPSPPRSSR